MQNKDKQNDRIRKRNIAAIAEYFRGGCKDAASLKLGVETEYFVIDKQGRPIAYAELEEVMQKLVAGDDTVVEEDGHFLGYYNKDFSVTLEPAAQLEISVMPQGSLAKMEEILTDFNVAYSKALEAEGYVMVNTGYHPTCKAEDLSLIPKKRYEYMNAYFAHSGSRGYQMMRATASTQVSVDYSNEDDFVRKYRLACALVPILALFTENCPVYEGKPSPRMLTRCYVWQGVDNERCLIPDCTFEAGFGFEAYAKELYDKRPILIIDPVTGQTIATGSKTIGEFYCDQELTTPEIEHLISMFFPDVRLKHYMEIRPADSLPIDLTLAYVALVREIFYNKEIFNELSAYLKVEDKQEIEAAKINLMEHGYHGKVYGKLFTEVADKIFALIKAYGDSESQQYIIPLAELVAKRMTPAQALWGDRK